MPFDPVTVVVSAVISVTVSAVISYVVASATAGRAERGKQAYAARGAVADEVRELRDRVKEYRGDKRSSMQRDGSIHFDDMIFCGSVLASAENLTFWRRWVVRRRLRHLVGRALFNLADERPDIGTTRYVMSKVIHQLKVQKGQPADDDGLLSRALQQPHNSPEIGKLAKQLDRLYRSSLYPW